MAERYDSPDLIPIQDQNNYQTQQGGYQAQGNYQQVQDPYAIQYNPNEVNYQPMTIDQWNSVPNVKTDYSNYWAEPDSFQPQKFSENTKQQVKCNDLGWLIAFWIHFALTLVLLVFLIIQKKTEIFNGSSPAESNITTNDTNLTNITTDVFLLDDFNDTNTTEPNVTVKLETFTSKDLLTCFGVSIAIAFVFNILHFFYAILAPVFYVHAGLIVTLILGIIGAIWLAFSYKFYYFIIFPCFFILIAICWYCIRRRYIKLTAAVMRVSMKIIIRYPGTIGFTILWGILSGLIAVAYSYMLYAILAANLTLWLYLYVIFSFLWVSICGYYTVYMTISGVSSTWYFLNDTEFMPSSPTIQSFKRAATTSFGSAAEASFILAVIQLCQAIVKVDLSGSCDNPYIACIYLCIRCILLCILNCLYHIFGFINRYALIYCATFGVPYREGVRRFGELNSGKFIDVILSGTVLGDVLTISNVGFTVLGALVGFGVGYILRKDGVMYKIWCCVFSLLFTFAIFEVFQGPIQVSFDTLLICFAENPERLKTTAFELSEELREAYSSGLEQKMPKDGIFKGAK